jgi:anhydro-N-acetylmuramic acid kinase
LNPELVRRIRDGLAPIPVLSNAQALGLDPAAKEAVAFPALECAQLSDVPGNVPEATGASGPRILGSYTPGAKSRRYS